MKQNLRTIPAENLTSRRLAPACRPQAPRVYGPCSLWNPDGFWCLTFKGRFAIIPQNQALFCLASLLVHPSAAPISGSHLAAAAFRLAGHHPDFCPDMFAIGSQHENALMVADILRRKRAALEAILDDPNESEPVVSDTLHQLAALSRLEAKLKAHDAKLDHSVEEIISQDLLRLHAMLATAVDLQGMPHPVLRAFSRHLLLYVLIPSVLISGPGCIRLFVYRPPAGVTWTNHF